MYTWSGSIFGKTASGIFLPIFETSNHSLSKHWGLHARAHLWQSLTRFKKKKKISWSYKLQPNSIFMHLLRCEICVWVLILLLSFLCIHTQTFDTRRHYECNVACGAAHAWRISTVAFNTTLAFFTFRNLLAQFWTVLVDYWSNNFLIKEQPNLVCSKLLFHGTRIFKVISINLLHIKGANPLFLTHWKSVNLRLLILLVWF